MTQKELQHMKMDIYKNFIKMKYGEELLEKLNYAINSHRGRNKLKVRTDDEFVDNMTELIEKENKEKR